MTVPIWRTPPPPEALLQAARNHRCIAVCLEGDRLPEWPSAVTAEGRALLAAWPAYAATVQFHAVNLLRGWLPDCTLWLLPSVCSSRVSDYFSDGLQWQDEALPQQAAVQIKPWFMPPQVHPARHVVVVGGGVAGAATARVLAGYGMRVSVCEAHTVAHAASGNRQGLLYAKISAHPTEQTELLLGGYGHSRRLLAQLLPEGAYWQGCGVLHLNHNETERQRNRSLAEQEAYRHWFYAVDEVQARMLSGLSDGLSDGLFWPQGAWLHPPAWVRALLDHPLITVYEHSPVRSARYRAQYWDVSAGKQMLQADHLVYCTGADSPQAAELAHLPWQLVRGQTSLRAADRCSGRLKTALSGAGYISPAWQGVHCFGASFHPHDNDRSLRASDEIHNRNLLAALHPSLAVADGEAALPQGHAAVRCDSPDHLPLVGAVGDAPEIRRVYARLAHDKNYRLYDACPYRPQLWVNSGHGSRGLTTAAWCAESLAADLLGLPNPLSPRLRQALHPNRYIIRALVRQT